MAAKHFLASWWFIVCFFLLCSCAVVRTEPTTRIALLAPFEGRYREVGYEALYAARLALNDSGRTDIELLPVDDGGTPESAANRARALAQDPQVIAVLTLGYAATHADIQFDTRPAYTIGNWEAPQMDITDAARKTAPFQCNQVCALAQFPKLRSDLSGITVESDAELPNDDFRARYLASAEFPPEPGLIAEGTYYVMFRLLTETPIAERPINIYQFNDDGQLVPAN
jgi:hypothetical protein